MLSKLALNVSAIALTATLVAGVSAKDLNPSVPIEAQVEVVRSEFMKGSVFMGPEITAHETTQYGSDKKWVKATLDVDRTKRWMLVLQASYSHAWRFYRSVSFSGGDTVMAADTKRQVLSCRYGCDYIEAAFFPLSAERAAAALQGGLRVRFNTESSVGAFVVDIPAAYFQGINNVAAGGTSAPPAPQLATQPEAPINIPAPDVGEPKPSASVFAESILRRVRAGMTRAEVEYVLGEPQSVMRGSVESQVQWRQTVGTASHDIIIMFNVSDERAARVVRANFTR